MFQQYSNESVAVDENPYLTGGKTLNGEISDEYPAKSISMGWNTPLNGVVAPCNLSIPPSLPPFSYSFGAVLSTFPSLIPSFNAIDSLNRAFTLTKNDISCSKISERLKVEHACELSEMHIANVKPKPCCLPDAAQEQKPNPWILTKSWKKQVETMPCIIEYEYMMEAEFYESKAEEAMKWLELFVFI